MKQWTMVALGMAVVAAPLAAQVEAIDQGTLTIRVADVEIAREQFTLVSGRRGGLAGSTLRATAAYPAVRPRTRLVATLERGVGQALTAYQLEADGPNPGRIVAELARNRFTVRTASPGRESANEYPGGADLVVLDDSLYSLWIAVADLATEEGVTLRAIDARTGWRGSFTAKRVRIPQAPTSIQLTGAIEGRILLDDSGRFAGVLIPARRLEVLRTTE